MSQTCCPVIRRCCPRLIPLIPINVCACPTPAACTGSAILIQPSQIISSDNTSITFIPNSVTGTFSVVENAGSVIGFQFNGSIPSNLNINLNGFIVSRECQGLVQILQNGTTVISEGPIAQFTPTIQSVNLSSVPSGTFFTVRVTFNDPACTSAEVNVVTFSITCA